jgi:hypothetical protein
MDTYGVIKHWLSVHSEDRDLARFPSPAVFDIDLPVDYKNVVALKLNDIHLPTPFVFSAMNRNTDVTMIVDGISHTIMIPDGNYTPLHLVNELTGRFQSLGVGNVQVAYNEVTQRITFANSNPFTMDFTRPTLLPQKCGAASYLGFGYATYASKSETVHFYYNSASYGPNVVEAPYVANVSGDSEAYLEVALYNSVDEIAPYPERSNWLLGARGGGAHNASFAKIPLRNGFESEQQSLSSFFFSDPPLERLLKLKFRFRYHDGRILDIRTDFTFTIEVTTLRNEFPHTFALNRTNYKVT